MINVPVYVTCTHIIQMIVYPWWEWYTRQTPRVTFPSRVNNIARYMTEHLTSSFDNIYSVLQDLGNNFVYKQ